jgi:glycosyltransferase involved in cell wall biosynthesis
MSFSKVSVLVPTRGRVARLKTLLASYERTASREDSETVFRVDDDDHVTLDFLLSYDEPLRLVVGPRMQGYQSMPTFFNELFVNSTGDVLMCGNDDMIFQTRGWAPRILAAANEYPDGLFDIGVHTHNEEHYPFSIISRRVAETLGFIWDPRIFWGDIYLRDVMAWFGRCVMLPTVQIDHDWAGYAPDQVFRETRISKSQVEGSEAYWSGPHADAVRDAVAKLTGLYVNQ